jgi:hypothetical protein
VASREGKELLRDKVRLAFALLGAMFMMVIFGYGISLDVENLAFAVHDQDQSPQSRAYLEAFRGSRYFAEQAPIRTAANCTSACNARKSNWRWRFRPVLAATCTPGANRWWPPGSTAACRSRRNQPQLRGSRAPGQPGATGRASPPAAAQDRCAWKRVFATTRTWSA